MTTSCRWHTAWSSLSSVVLVFVLLLQSVQSYEFADIDDYFDTLVDVVPVGLQNDTEFPGRKLDISRVKRKLDQYDRQVLLFEHNTHRRTTRPLASNMAFMVSYPFMRLAMGVHPKYNSALFPYLHHHHCTSQNIIFVLLFCLSPPGLSTRT